MARDDYLCYILGMKAGMDMAELMKDTDMQLLLDNIEKGRWVAPEKSQEDIERMAREIRVDYMDVDMEDFMNSIEGLRLCGGSPQDVSAIHAMAKDLQDALKKKDYMTSVKLARDFETQVFESISNQLAQFRESMRKP